DPSDNDSPGYDANPRAGRGGVPVLVRPDGMLLPGVDDQAAWPAASGDELRWSFGCDLAGALAGLNLPLAGPGGGSQDQILAGLDALDARADTDRAPSPVTAGPDADRAARAAGAGRDAGSGDAPGQASSDPGS